MFSKVDKEIIESWIFSIGDYLTLVPPPGKKICPIKITVLFIKYPDLKNEIFFEPEDLSLLVVTTKRAGVILYKMGLQVSDQPVINMKKSM